MFNEVHIDIIYINNNINDFIYKKKKNVNPFPFNDIFGVYNIIYFIVLDKTWFIFSFFKAIEVIKRLKA